MITLVLLAWLAFTGVIALMFAVGLWHSTRRQRANILTKEERAQWEQIERHWQ